MRISLHLMTTIIPLLNLFLAIQGSEGCLQDENIE